MMSTNEWLFTVKPPKDNPGEGQPQMAFTFKIFGYSKIFIFLLSVQINLAWRL